MVRAAATPVDPMHGSAPAELGVQAKKSGFSLFGRRQSLQSPTSTPASPSQQSRRPSSCSASPAPSTSSLPMASIEPCRASPSPASPLGATERFEQQRSPLRTRTHMKRKAVPLFEEEIDIVDDPLWDGSVTLPTSAPPAQPQLSHEVRAPCRQRAQRPSSTWSGPCAEPDSDSVATSGAMEPSRRASHSSSLTSASTRRRSSVFSATYSSDCDMSSYTSESSAPSIFSCASATKVGAPSSAFPSRARPTARPFALTSKRSSMYASALHDVLPTLSRSAQRSSRSAELLDAWMALMGSESPEVVSNGVFENATSGDRSRRSSDSCHVPTPPSPILTASVPPLSYSSAGSTCSHDDSIASPSTPLDDSISLPRPVSIYSASRRSSQDHGAMVHRTSESVRRSSWVKRKPVPQAFDFANASEDESSSDDHFVEALSRPESRASSAWDLSDDEGEDREASSPATSAHPSPLPSSMPTPRPLQYARSTSTSSLATLEERSPSPGLFVDTRSMETESSFSSDARSNLFADWTWSTFVPVEAEVYAVADKVKSFVVTSVDWSQTAFEYDIDASSLHKRRRQSSTLLTPSRPPKSVRRQVDIVV